MVREKGILLFNIQVGNMENFFSCRYEILLRTSSHEIANLRKNKGTIATGALGLRAFLWDTSLYGAALKGQLMRPITRCNEGGGINMAECFICKRQFTCGVLARSASACWCQAAPALLPVPLIPATASEAAQASCCCPQCLQTLLALKQR